MDWYAKHQNKWHRIAQVKDTGIPAGKPGGGNNYHLDGVDEPVHQSKIEKLSFEKPEEMDKAEKIKGGLADGVSDDKFDSKQLRAGIKVEMEHTDDPDKAREIAKDHLTEDVNYYKKLREMEKQEPMMVRETADGKRELIPGVEPLRQRWEKIKKALDNESAILDIGSQEFDDTADLEEDGQEEEQPEQPENPLEDKNEASPEQSENDENAPEDDEQPNSEETPQGDSTDPEDQLAELVELLSQQGHSEAEINYIVHGHVMPTTSLDDAKVDSEQAMAQHKLDHAKRMSDVEHTQAQKELDTNDLDKQHKQRLLDLEYEYAKKEKEMEADFKAKEYELKLQAIKNKQEQSNKSAKVDYAQSRSQDAKQTSQKEKKGE